MNLISKTKKLNNSSHVLFFSLVELLTDFAERERYHMPQALAIIEGLLATISLQYVTFVSVIYISQIRNTLDRGWHQHEPELERFDSL